MIKKIKIAFMVFFTFFFLLNYVGVVKAAIDANQKEIKKTVLDLTQRDEAFPEINSLLGVVSGPLPPYGSTGIDLTKHLKDIGVDSIMLQGYYDDSFSMEQIFQFPEASHYPSWTGDDANDTKNYHWDNHDQLYEHVLEKGFSAFFCLGSDFPHLRKHDFNGPQNSDMEKNWIVAADHVVRRFKENKKQQLKYVALWNGFPHKNLWDRSDAEFIQFWSRAYHVLKYNHPKIKFGGPGFTKQATEEVVKGEKGIVFDFLKNLYKAKIKPDWIGVQFFFNDALEVYTAGKAYHDLLKGKGQYQSMKWSTDGFFNQVEFFVTRYGIKKEEGLLGGADFAATWIALQHIKTKKAWYYRANATKTKKDNLEIEEQGLFKNDSIGSYTQEAHVFRLFSLMANKFKYKMKTSAYLEDDKTKQKIWVLAGRTEEKETKQTQYGLLLANPGDNSVALEVGFKNKRKYLYHYLVNKENNGRHQKQDIAGFVVVPEQSAMLVVFE